MPTAGACGAVRSLRLLHRLSVSIVFKMLPYQSFKTMRLCDMARLCGYRNGVPHPVASPSHLRFISVSSRRSRADCLRLLRPLRRRLSIPHAVIRPRCVSLLSPPVRHDKRGGCLRPSYCLLGGRSDGAGGLIVAIMRPCRCLPRITCRRAAISYRRRLSVPAWHRRSPILIMLAIHYRPA